MLFIVETLAMTQNRQIQLLLNSRFYFIETNVADIRMKMMIVGDIATIKKSLITMKVTVFWVLSTKTELSFYNLGPWYR